MDGKSIKHLREWHGLTQTDVAHAAGMHQGDVSAVENGRKQTPELLRRVAGGVLKSTSPSRVIARHGDKLRAYLEDVGASNCRVFGSTARGTDRWDSDIDIVAELPEDVSLLDIVRWEEDLRRIAGGVRVELVPDGEGFRQLGMAAKDAVAL